MNSDELTEVSPFTDSQRDIEPPPLLVGVGAEEMTARRLYISWPGHQSNYSTANLYTGRVNRLWGEGAQDEGAPRRGGGGNVIVYKYSLRRVRNRQKIGCKGDSVQSSVPVGRINKSYFMFLPRPYQ